MMKNIIIILILTLFTFNAICQCDNLGHLSNPVWYLGWNNLSNDDLNIKHEALKPINFYTFNILRMTLSPTGLLGIGTAPAFHLDVADDINLNPGTFPNYGYRWAGDIVLKTNSTSNIFLGVDAGNATTSGSANTFLGNETGLNNTSGGGGNTFVGWYCGRNGTTADESTFVGSRAGENATGNNNCYFGVSAGQGIGVNSCSENSFFGNLSGQSNTGSSNTFIGIHSGQNNQSNLNAFIGANSGQFNTSGRNNVFVGANTGNSNTTSNDLTFIGFESGLNNSNGRNNTFLGSLSGHTNKLGVNNYFAGYQSGFSNDRGNNNSFSGSGSGYSNVNGEDNTFYGFNSGNALIGGKNNLMAGSNAGSFVTSGTNTTLLGSNTTATNGLTNAGAIGAGAGVVTSDALILGNNNVKVGIGLSAAPGGPLNKFEINADPLSFNYTGVGGSGLKFRQLNSSSSSVTPNGKVLTLDGIGNVVLTDDIGGNGSVTSCGGLIPTDQNYISKWRTISGTTVRELCKTEGIYELPTAPYTVGIGVGSSVTVGASNNIKLDMKGDLYLRHNFNSSVGGDIWMEDHLGNPRRVFTMYGNFGQGALAIGPDAGSINQFAATTANNSVYIGRMAGSNSGNAINNTFIGDNSGFNYGSGTPPSVFGYNTFLGNRSGVNLISGDKNTFIGEATATALTSGYNNTFVGRQSGNGGISSGNDNVFVGNSTYITAATGSQNIMIGAGAHGLPVTPATSLTNAVSIGYTNRVVCDNCVTMAAQIGPGITEQQVGIGYMNPGGVAIGSTGAQAKLYVDDYNNAGTAAFFNGDVYSSTGNYLTSDPMFKDNIQTVTNVDAIINQLEVKTFDFKINNFPSIKLPQGNHYGFLATDVVNVLPCAVKTMVNPALYDSLGNVVVPAFDFKAVNYTEFVPVLFAAVKQLKSQLDSLQQIVGSCCNMQPINQNGSSSNRSAITLTNNESIVLNQNTPNPFNEHTEITYNIPESVKDAVFLFYDTSGKVLNRFEISHRGQGSLTVYGEDLSSGIYTYTMMIDGKNQQTKKMMKQ